MVWLKEKVRYKCIFLSSAVHNVFWFYNVSKEAQNQQGCINHLKYPKWYSSIKYTLTCQNLWMRQSNVNIRRLYRTLKSGKYRVLLESERQLDISLQDDVNCQCSHGIWYEKLNKLLWRIFDITESMVFCVIPNYPMEMLLPFRNVWLWGHNNWRQMYLW